MTTPLFLIAHSVRGEAAFDVALQMECPHCISDGDPTYRYGCAECDGEGYWWIIPTSGHRAFPYWSCAIEELDFLNGKHPDKYLGVMPSGWPDHYRHGPAPTLDIMSLFKAQREAKPHIPRRL